MTLLVGVLLASSMRMAYSCCRPGDKPVTSVNVITHAMCGSAIHLPLSVQPLYMKAEHTLLLTALQVAMAKNKPDLLAVDPASCPYELAQLIDDCFASNPRERPSSGEVMKLLAQLIRLHTPHMAG